MSHIGRCAELGFWSVVEWRVRSRLVIILIGQAWLFVTVKPLRHSTIMGRWLYWVYSALLHSKFTNRYIRGRLPTNYTSYHYEPLSHHGGSMRRRNPGLGPSGLSPLTGHVGNLIRSVESSSAARHLQNPSETYPAVGMYPASEPNSHTGSETVKITLYRYTGRRFTTIWASSWQNVSSGVSDQVRLKPACSPTEASMRLEILVTETRDITLSRQRTTKAPLLFAYDIRHVFSWPGSYNSSLH